MTTLLMEQQPSFSIFFRFSPFSLNKASILFFQAPLRNSESKFLICFTLQLQLSSNYKFGDILVYSLIISSFCIFSFWGSWANPSSSKLLFA